MIESYVKVKLHTQRFLLHRPSMKSTNQNAPFYFDIFRSSPTIACITTIADFRNIPNVSVKVRVIKGCLNFPLAMVSVQTKVTLFEMKC